MKNYNEMANDVLRKIEEHKINEKKKRKVIKRVVIPVCCFCIISLIGVGLWQGDFLKTKPPVSLDDSTIIGEKDWIDEIESEDTAWEEDLSSEYTVSNIVIQSNKAQESKFDVEMTVNVSTVDKNGNANMYKTEKLPLSAEHITLEIINKNDEISIVCSGFWRLEKLVNGKYTEVASANREANSGCGPNSSCFVFFEMEDYREAISEGKYRIISPTLNIAKSTENGLVDYYYQNEKQFIIYKEFEIVE